MIHPLRCLLLAGLCSLPFTANAHSFGQMYTLPVPVWMYLYGATAALVLSFVIVAWFVSTGNAQTNFKTRDLSGSALVRRLTHPALLSALRITGVALLVFCMACGFWGTRNSYANFNMTFFWIVFVLGFTYLTALIGDFYAAFNPWKTLTRWLEKILPRAFAGRFVYPKTLGHWPALLLYMGFIWIELFARTNPWSLSWILLGYTAVNLTGAWLWGREAWFRHGEFFGVFLNLTAKMAPLDWRRDAKGTVTLTLRQPFIGLLEDRASSMSLLLFVLFMLSSTAFDGLRETAPWMKLFWQDVHGLLKPWVGDNIVHSYPLLKGLFSVWQTASLLLSPFFYLALYLLFIALARLITRSEKSVRELALDFAFSLLPIALVYNLTHYYTLAIGQGAQIFRLISDPFGWGWDVFGTTRAMRTPIVLDAGTVWHTQVWLILFGHIISVYLAHIVALRVFRSSRAATLSQLPMLLLMVAFTTIGLWILSLPMAPAGDG